MNENKEVEIIIENDKLWRLLSKKVRANGYSTEEHIQNLLEQAVNE